MLELGTDLRTVQILLGHRSLSSTARYTHLTEARRLVLRSPLEALSTEQGRVLGKPPVPLTAACIDRTSSAEPRVQVGDIARAFGAALRDSCALSPDQHVVLRAIERCRTAALGGHKYACNHCGYTVPVYNSCRNRHCPTCQSIEQRRWLERRRERILLAAIAGERRLGLPWHRATHRRGVGTP